MLSARALNIALIEIDAKIVGVGKVRRVGARTAPHIKHSPDSAQIVVSQDWSEFLLRKRSLPQPVRRRVIEDARYPVHQHFLGRESLAAWVADMAKGKIEFLLESLRINSLSQSVSV